MQKGWIHHRQGRLGISLTLECITPVNQAKSVLCLTAVQNSKEHPYNKELLSGPDLTNQIIGVLTRFCRSHISSSSGFSNYCQQLFLKFLWWDDHDIDMEPHDYVICGHVFVQHCQPAVQIMPCAGQPRKMKQFLGKQQQILFIIIFM